MGSPTEWNPRYVGAAGLRLRVGRRGAGRPLLLITGIGAHLEMWAPFVGFAGDRELIAFDPPGAGLSQRPRLPLTMRGLAGVVADLLDALKLERVDVLGYAYQLHAGLGWSSLPWLHRVQHESLIVAGEQDPTVPLRNARLLAGRLPHARLHVVKGGGHLFLLDEPENAAPPIRAFLDADEAAIRAA